MARNKQNRKPRQKASKQDSNAVQPNVQDPIDQPVDGPSTMLSSNKHSPSQRAQASKDVPFEQMLTIFTSIKYYEARNEPQYIATLDEGAIDTQSPEASLHLMPQHPPCTVATFRLEPITVRQLRSEHPNYGKILFLRVDKVSLGGGMFVYGHDSEGTPVTVTSVIAFPFPGGPASMSQGTVIAVKEPRDINHGHSRMMIQVHHPTDIVRVSKYHPRIGHIHTGLDIQGYGDNADLIKKGDMLLVTGKAMEAVDCYSKSIEQCRELAQSENDHGRRHMTALLMKRAFSYLQLGLYASSLEDVKKILDLDGNRQDALRLSSSVLVKLESYRAARDQCERLLSLNPTDHANLELVAEVLARCSQADGHIDLGSIAKAPSLVEYTKNVPTFVGDIEVRKSSIAGRGIFATKNIRQGQLLLCEKPIAVAYDTDLSTFDHGVYGLMGPGVCVNRRHLSLLQVLAEKTSVDSKLLNKAFDLYAGPLRKPLTEPAKIFDR